MPVRWFQHKGEIMAKAHLLICTPTGYTIDRQTQSDLDVPLKAFLLNVNDLSDPECQGRYNLPPMAVNG